MNVLQRMEADKIVQPVTRGGLISPFGYACINTDGSAYGSVTGCKNYAIKRAIADEYLARAAGKVAGVSLLEEHEVQEVSFIEVDSASGTARPVPVTEASHSGYWKVKVSSKSASTGAATELTLEANMLLICDGTNSYLAQKVGVVPKGSQPEAVCSHSYAKRGTHNWSEADGVMIFSKSVLPGYSALFRHYNGDVYFGTYILPGGKAKATSIAPFENEAFEHHPYVKAALGDKVEWEERRVVAPIRLGGVPQAFSRQLLIAGDAAGHVDPLTGEGIHTAMMAGKIAAQSIAEMATTQDFSVAACRAYDLRCYDAFGYEFIYSSIAARVIYFCPIAIDAVAVVGQRRGQAFLDFFGEVMTGVRPKSHFLKVDLVLELGFEVLRQAVIQYVLRREPLVPVWIGQAAVDKFATK